MPLGNDHPPERPFQTCTFHRGEDPVAGVKSWWQPVT